MDLVNRWFQPPRLHVPGHGAEKKASWLELFYDLIYVAAIIQLGDHLAHNVNWMGALAFMALFLPLWSTWTTVTFYSNRFIVDDARHRALIFLQMFGIGGMAVSIEQVYVGNTAQWAACYALVRLMLVLMYARTWRHEPATRDQSRLYVLGFGAGLVLWTASIFVPAPWVYAMWALAMAIDLWVPLSRRARAATLRSPPDIMHMTERYGIFTIIVLGESFVKVLSEVASKGSSLHLIYMAGLCLAITCSLWWLYFDDVAGSRIKARASAPYIWIYSHLPFQIAVTAVGVALKKAVYFKFEVYAGSLKYAVLLCGSLALAFLTVAVIDWVTERRVTELKEEARLYMRVAAGVLLLLLAPTITVMPGAAFLTLVAIACIVQVLFDLSMAPNATSVMEHDHDAQHIFDQIRKDGQVAAAPAADEDRTRPRRDVSDAVRKGTPNELRRDLYFHLMEASWTQVLLGVGFLYLLTNVFFAALYMLEPSGVSELDHGSFLDAFSFSVQTMATIGYGVMHPLSTWANVIVAVEAGTSLLGIALVTGLMFAKASRARASVLFSQPMVVTIKDGQPTLMFRVGNARGNDVVEATIHVSVMVDQTSEEGHRFRKLYDLELVRDRTPVFAVSWTVMHVLDEASPVRFLAEDQPDGSFFAMIVTLVGHDGTYGQTVHDRHMYYPEDLVFGARFLDVISNLADGRLMVDYEVFHEVETDLAALEELRRLAAEE